MKNSLLETYKSNKFKDETAGYIDTDGSFIYTEEYHGEEDNEYKNLGLPEFSSTHYEEDTCVRIYKEPNEIQYKKLEEIIDYFLNTYSYCKVEIWDKPNGNFSFYNVYSLFEGACKDYTWNEQVGNWTGYKLVKIIKNNIHRLNEEFDEEEIDYLSRGWITSNGDVIKTNNAPHYTHRHNTEDQDDDIRYNFGYERYIGLPKTRPTYKQLKVLEDLLYYYFIDAPMVGIRNTNIEINYDMNDKGDFKYFSISPKDYTPEEVIKVIQRLYNSGLREELLLELNRNQLINKSKHSDNYKDQSKGRNRWERRNHSKIDRRVDQYNKIDMNSFFKKDELKVGINVHGETDDYVVTIRFNGALRAIQDEIKRNNNKLEFKCVLIALQRTFNNGDVFVSCSCPDFKYRIAFNATKGGYNSGTPELRASNITNPHDTKGAGCKHINLVIGNIDWVMKVASVINNYIHYMEEHYQRKYADLIFPKLFDMPYQRAVQLNLFDTNDELNSDSDEIKLSNRYGRTRGQFRSDERINNMRNFKTDEEPYIFSHNNQLKLDLDNEENDKPLLKQNVSSNSKPHLEQEEKGDK